MAIKANIQYMQSLKSYPRKSYLKKFRFGRSLPNSDSIFHFQIFLKICEKWLGDCTFKLNLYDKLKFSCCVCKEEREVQKYGKESCIMIANKKQNSKELFEKSKT